MGGSSPLFVSLIAAKEGHDLNAELAPSIQGWMGYQSPATSIWLIGLCCWAVGGCAGAIDAPPQPPPSDSNAATVEVPPLAAETAQSRTQEDVDAQLPQRQRARCPQLDGPASDEQCRRYDERLKELERRIEELKNKIFASPPGRLHMP